MTIRTITVSDITKVDFDPGNDRPYFFMSEKYVWVRNKSPAEIYVSAESDPLPGDAGVLEILSGACGMAEMPASNILYFSGGGDVEIHTDNIPTCPWNGSPGSGGGGTPSDVQPLTAAQMHALLMKLED